MTSGAKLPRIEIVISDDDSPPLHSRARPRQSNVKYPQANPKAAGSTRTHRDSEQTNFLDLDNDQSTTMSSQKPKQRLFTGPAFKPQKNSLATQTQPTPISRSRDSIHGAPRLASNSRDSSRERMRGVIDLCEDEDSAPRSPKMFKKPRGWFPESTKRSPSTNFHPSDSLEDSSRTTRKRPRDAESSLGSPNPSKRSKQSQEAAIGSLEESYQASDLDRSGAAKSVSSSTISQRKDKKPSEVSKLETATPPRLQPGLSPSRRGPNYNTSSQRSTKSVSSTSNRPLNGGSAASFLANGPIQIVNPGDGSDDTSEYQSTSQNLSDRQPRKRSSPAARSDPLTLRGRPATDSTGSKTLNVDKTLGRTVSGTEPNDDSAGARGARLENHRPPAIKASNDSSEPTGIRTPTRLNRKDDVRTPSQAGQRIYTKQSSHRTSPGPKSQKLDRSEGDRNDVASLIGKSKRKAASDEDQGYASLSSNNGDELQNDEADSRPDSGAVLGPRTRSTLAGPEGDSTPERRPNYSVVEAISRSTRKSAPGIQLQNAAISKRGPLNEQESPGVSRSFLHISRSRSPDRRQSHTTSQFQQKATALSSLTADNAAKMSHDLDDRGFVDDRPIQAEEADAQLRSEAGMENDELDADEDEESTFALPTAAASALKSTPAYSNLPLANQVEKVLGKYLEELRGDHEYWTSVSLGRARLSTEAKVSVSDASHSSDEEPTSFANLEPLNFSPIARGASAKSNSVWGIQKMAPNGSAASSKSIFMTAPYVGFRSATQEVPNYTHYVSIKNNFLAHNVISLHCWPYFGDDFDLSEAANLNEQYKLDIDDRQRKLLRILQGQKYETYVESALDDLGCSWSDLLRFLLEHNPDVGTDSGVRKALQGRHSYCHSGEDFDRDCVRWRAVLNLLPPSNPEKMARVAVLCENFQKLAKFSIWHVARRCDMARLPEASQEPTNAQPTDNEFTCRICLRFDCPYHGEFKEGADDEDSDAESGSVATIVATDILHPQRVNYRSRVAFPPALPNASDRVENAATRRMKTDIKYWPSTSYQHKADERGPFYPCHHPRTSCADAECSCFLNGVPCEKICSCAPDCPRKFQGCSCSVERPKKGQRSLCWEDDRCVCYQLGRECDPDLCSECGVCDVLDRANKYDEKVLLGRCHNAGIQRAVPKHTILGDSGVHGLGLYACERIKTNDFVGEYKGEIITKEEADRRGAVYEHQKLSYLFSLNATQEIDSTYFGNKIRFINHAHGGKANLYPRIIMVNSVHRIALYAVKEIRSGEELLFDYGPKFPDEQLGGKKNKKSAPHVRNVNLVRDFLDVEENVDEFGNRRAKGVSQSSKRSNGNRKARGGARAGAGRKPLERGPRQHEQLEDTHDESEEHDYDEQESESEPEVQDRSQPKPNAGERLAAFNISDDGPDEAMDVDSNYDDSHPEASEDDDSEVSGGPSEHSEVEEDEDEDIVARSSRRAGVSTRGFTRR